MRKYRTAQGDIWDIIALKMYPKIGGERLMHVLLQNNPKHRDVIIFPANIELNIPYADIPIVKNLPPWVKG